MYDAYDKGISGLKIGDPEKAVQFIISVINSNNPPLRLPVGSQAAYTIRQAYTKRLEEVNAWVERAAEAD